MNNIKYHVIVVLMLIVIQHYVAHNIVYTISPTAIHRNVHVSRVAAL